MAVKKSEIYSSLWASCDALRGGMDASQYKDYVLVLLFVKYVSDKYAGDPNGVIEVPKGGSFADMVALKGDKEIGEKINVIIAKLAEANDLKGVIDVADFNDPEKLGTGKEMVDRLSNLVAIFNRPELDFRKNRAEGDDILGDAYEYLMRHFATESGKSKGQFYTPAEVSRIMAKAIGISASKSADQTIYDPTCGSGSLLLKARDEAPHGITIYGQEKDVATRALAKMNMVLHDCPTAEIWRDNTLSSPHFKNPDGGLKTFDFIVANPPFSDKAWSTGIDPANDQFGRFEYGAPPAKNGDYAYLLHVIASLKTNGKGAVILPHGVLFRGNAESEIRKKIIGKGYIKGIIGLPANLFYGTGIPACIVVLDKENAHARSGIFMIDASKGFVKDGNKNRLRAQDLHKIVDAFTKQLTLPRYSRMVPLAEIEKHDFNLNIPRYIDSSEPEDLQDIEAHLKGGIPLRDLDALADYWAVLPSVRGELFGAGDRPGYASPKVEPANVKPIILGHAEFASFSDRVNEVFADWRAAHIERLKGIMLGDKPKLLIEEIAEDLLARFADVPLIDKYDVYQHLMTYWAEVMQDDAYIVAQEGWKAARQVRELVKNAEGKFTETPDITIGRQKLKAELIPPALIVARFFAKDQAALEALEAKAEEIGRALEEMDEESGGEDGLLFEAKTERGKLTAKSVKDRLKDIKGDKTADEEREALNACLKLIEQEKETADAAKEAKTALDTKTLRQYAKLTDAEITSLLVEDKWLTSLRASVISELDSASRRLMGRVALLTTRYAVPLAGLAENVEALQAKVGAHLSRQQLIAGSVRLTGFGRGKGTKQTDIGEIPEDWDVVRIADVLDEISMGPFGSDIKVSNFVSQGVPVLSGDNIRTFVLKDEFKNFVSHQKAKELKKAVASRGDIVVTHRGTIGQIAHIPDNSAYEKYVISQSQFRARFSNKVSPIWVAIYFLSESGSVKLLEGKGHTGVPAIAQATTTFRKLQIPVPPMEEQLAIIEVLSDMDAEVAALGALTEKARLLKLGMTQELLTGRTRVA